MSKPLTPVTIANLRAKVKRYEVSDGGCQGLRVVVFPSGKKSFIARYRFRGAVQRKLTLGTVLTERSATVEPDATPEIGTPLSLAAARELATKALRQAKSGTDPAAAKQHRRQEQLAAESDTLAAVAAEFLRREGGKLRSFDQRRADLELACASLGRLPVAQITRGQYVRLLDRIADERGPVRSDRVLAALSRLLTWHAHRSDFVSPLVRGMRRTSIAERARDRVLGDDELKRVVETAEAEQRRGNLFGGYVLFLLHTAARRGEAGGLRRSELSDGGKTWTIPAARCKSKRDVVVPLSRAAQRIIAAQPVLPGGDHVFSAVTGQRALTGIAKRKAEFDKACGVSGYTIHDLRRSSRTLLSRAGIPVDIAEMCLGHALVGVRATYDRHAYESEKRAAFEALAAQIERIIRPPADLVVVPLSLRARVKPTRRK